MWVRTVAPVAVKPDTDSKYALIGFASCSVARTKGSPPKAGTSSQISAATRKPSRGPIRSRPAVTASSTQPGRCGNDPGDCERPDRLVVARGEQRREEEGQAEVAQEERRRD